MVKYCKNYPEHLESLLMNQEEVGMITGGGKELHNNHWFMTKISTMC